MMKITMTTSQNMKIILMTKTMTTKIMMMKTTMTTKTMMMKITTRRTTTTMMITEAAEEAEATTGTSRETAREDSLQEAEEAVHEVALEEVEAQIQTQEDRVLVRDQDQAEEAGHLLETHQMITITTTDTITREDQEAAEIAAEGHQIQEDRVLIQDQGQTQVQIQDQALEAEEETPVLAQDQVTAAVLVEVPTQDLATEHQKEVSHQ